MAASGFGVGGGDEAASCLFRMGPNDMPSARLTFQLVADVIPPTKTNLLNSIVSKYISTGIAMLDCLHLSGLLLCKILPTGQVNVHKLKQVQCIYP